MTDLQSTINYLSPGMFGATCAGLDTAATFYRNWESSVRRNVPAHRLLEFSPADGWEPPAVRSFHTAVFTFCPISGLGDIMVTTPLSPIFKKALMSNHSEGMVSGSSSGVFSG